MTKINIDLSSVETTISMLDDVINIYNKVINVLDYTVIPYNFEKRYSYQSNYSNLKKDKQKLIDLKDFVSKSLADLNSIDESLSSMAMKLPDKKIIDKDFSL